MVDNGFFLMEICRMPIARGFAKTPHGGTGGANLFLIGNARTVEGPYPGIFPTRGEWLGGDDYA